MATPSATSWHPELFSWVAAGWPIGSADVGLRISGGPQMSHNLNSLKGGYIGDYIGDYYRAY